MKEFKIYYPRLDAYFTIISDDYTNLVRLCNELRGFLVVKVYTEEGDQEDEFEIS